MSFPVDILTKKEYNDLSEDDEIEEDESQTEICLTGKNSSCNYMEACDSELDIAALNTRPILEVQLLKGNKSREHNHNDLDRFFLSMSETCKKFTPYSQAVLRKKIFDLVSEVEIDQLARSSLSEASVEKVCSSKTQVSVTVTKKNMEGDSANSSNDEPKKEK